MGRKPKGDRHKIVASMPPRAADLVKTEAATLGCFIGDYLGWVVAHQIGLSPEVPLGQVTKHPDPSPTNDARARYAAMVPRAAANSVRELAEQRGITMGDLVTDLICRHLGVAFQPRVMKKASGTVPTSSPTRKQLPMTG